MAQVKLDVGGRQYEVVCRDGEEDRLRMLARLVDSRTSDVVRAIGRGHEARQLLMTALLLADELDEARGSAASQRIEAAQRVASMERCAERLETLAARLEKPGQSA
jgi:cell division protein ZapA